MDPLISTLIIVVVILLLVWAACSIIDQTMPPGVQMPCKVVVGVLGLIAVLYKLAPMAHFG